MIFLSTIVCVCVCVCVLSLAVSFVVHFIRSFISTMIMSLSKLRELVMDREAWHAAIHGFTKNWTWLSNWTELKPLQYSCLENPMDRGAWWAIVQRVWHDWMTKTFIFNDFQWKIHHINIWNRTQSPNSSWTLSYVDSPKCKMTVGTKLHCAEPSHSVTADTLWPNRLLCPQNFPGKTPGVGCHFLLHKARLTLSKLTGHSRSRGLQSWLCSPSLFFIKSSVIH